LEVVFVCFEHASIILRKVILEEGDFHPFCSRV
jgi:hypothetical protein